jgi:hypothetical protein
MLQNQRARFKRSRMASIFLNLRRSVRYWVTDRIGEALAIVVNDDEFRWLDLPEDLLDPNGWDRYWNDQISHGYGPPIFDMWCNDRPIIKAMSEHAMKRVLCAGAGISLEPRVLAAAGFDVVALDFSPRALEIARAFRPDDTILRGFFDRSSLRPGGHLEYVVGDILDSAKSPGPFDVIIERRTAQNYQEPELDRIMNALVARLSPQGVLFTHCHDGSWRPPAKRRHVTGDWCRAHGWPVWNGKEAKPDGRVAWLVTTTG